VPELDGLAADRVQTPWKLDGTARRQLGYPDPLVDLS
jgi:deoxyribodipyrimidine photolyase